MASATLARAATFSIGATESSRSRKPCRRDRWRLLEEPLVRPRGGHARAAGQVAGAFGHARIVRRPGGHPKPTRTGSTRRRPGPAVRGRGSRSRPPWRCSGGQRRRAGGVGDIRTASAPRDLRRSRSLANSSTIAAPSDVWMRATMPRWFSSTATSWSVPSMSDRSIEMLELIRCDQHAVPHEHVGRAVSRSHSWSAGFSDRYQAGATVRCASVTHRGGSKCADSHSSSTTAAMKASQRTSPVTSGRSRTKRRRSPRGVRRGSRVGRSPTAVRCRLRPALPWRADRRSPVRPWRLQEGRRVPPATRRVPRFAR